MQAHDGGDDADPVRLDAAPELRRRAHRRAREAEARAAEARSRSRELTAVMAGDRGGSELKDAARQAEHARAALEHSAEGHERAAMVHEAAARLDERRGDAGGAAAHRDHAERSHRAAGADRARSL